MRRYFTGSWANAGNLTSGRGRKLTYEDTRHYQRIVVALNETIRDMKEIDEVIRQHGDWPTAFSGNNT